MSNINSLLAWVVERHVSYTFPKLNSMLPSITCRFVTRNIHINGEEAVIYAKLHDKLSTNSSTFVARFSGVFAEVEAPGVESGNH